uniref:Uncharacterized protein n=1 Tax=Triticum urartu TaxID=4572 RepID=A0A8R7THS5_TRIUA
MLPVPPAPPPTLKTQPPLLTHGDDQRRIWNHRERRPGGARAGRKRRDRGGNEGEGGARGAGEGGRGR